MKIIFIVSVVVFAILAFFWMPKIKFFIIKYTWKDTDKASNCASSIIGYLYDGKQLPRITNNQLVQWLSTLDITLESFDSNEMLNKIVSDNKDVEAIQKESKEIQLNHIFERWNKKGKLVYLGSFDYSKEIFLSTPPNGLHHLVNEKIIEYFRNSWKLRLPLHYKCLINTDSAFLSTSYEL